MNQDVASSAREIAAALSELDPGLPAKVEAEINTHGQALEEQRFDAGLTVGLAGLVLAAAQFAYQIHRDRKKDKELAPDVLRRRLRVELTERDYPDTQQRNKVIEAAVQIIDQQR